MTTRRRGGALVLALLAVTALTAIALLVASFSDASARQAAAGRAADHLRNAARAGLAHARLAAWDAWPGRAGEGTPDVDAWRAWLDGQGLRDGQPRWLGPRGVGLAVAPPAGGALQVGTPPGPDPAPVEPARVQVRLDRRDDGATTWLTLSATAEGAPGDRRTAEVVLRLAGRRWAGLDYALLANNMNCIFCHLRVDSARRRWGLDAGPYPRAKVASLESLALRPSNGSLLGGTLYVQGHLLGPSGLELDAPLGGAAGLQGETLDAVDGTLVGRPLVNLVDATPSAAPCANFYKRYPTDPAAQFDGALPARFPPVVADPDGDRRTDDDEWRAATRDWVGEVTGGRIVPVPAGGRLAARTLPATGTATSLPGGGPPGHVVLVGTAADPLRLDGHVAIDGDVVLSGVIAGKGSLVARGNVYLVGDVVYADGVDGAGKRTFGRAPDGSENALAIAAAGSVLHGPYMVDKDGFAVTDANLDGFTGQELGLFNRMEWAKAQPFYDPATKGLTTRDTGVPNSAHVPGYRPRYYVLDPAAAPRMFLGGATWDNAHGVWSGKEKGTPDTPVDLTGLVEGRDYVRAALNPAGGWLAPDDLRAIVEAHDAARPPGPYELDALIYTSNAAFIMARPSGSSGGRMELNGALIAADAGVLVPGAKGAGDPTGLVINDDARVRRLLRLEEPLDGPGLVTVVRLER